MSAGRAHTKSNDKAGHSKNPFVTTTIPPKYLHYVPARFTRIHSFKKLYIYYDLSHNERGNSSKRVFGSNASKISTMCISCMWLLQVVVCFQRCKHIKWHRTSILLLFSYLCRIKKRTNQSCFQWNVDYILVSDTLHIHSNFVLEVLRGNSSGYWRCARSMTMRNHG